MTRFVSRPFPTTRMRRMRRNDFSRRMMRETCLNPSDLILPVFVIDGNNVCEGIPAMPGVERLSIDLLVTKARHASSLGVLFSSFHL